MFHCMYKPRRNAEALFHSMSRRAVNVFILTPAVYKE